MPASSKGKTPHWRHIPAASLMTRFERHWGECRVSVSRKPGRLRPWSLTDQGAKGIVPLPILSSKAIGVVACAGRGRGAGDGGLGSSQAAQFLPDKTRA